jgi:biopolymer transport protein ExbD
MGFLHKRRSGRQLQEVAELEVTPFMNLMIVLVPVLLLSLVFTHTTVIELNFPTGESSAEFDPEAVHLEVAVYPDRMVVGDGHNYAELMLVMQELKQRMPEKRDITVLLDDATSYQTVVHVMDVVRSRTVVQGLDVVEAELFPVISLGTTVPPVPATAQISGAVATEASAS